MLEKKGIEKDRFSGPKGSTGRGYGQPAQPVEEPVDWLPLSDRGLVEDAPKTFSLSQWPSLLGRGDYFLGRGPIEAMITCHALNAPTASEPIDP